MDSTLAFPCLAIWEDILAKKSFPSLCLFGELEAPIEGYTWCLAFKVAWFILETSESANLKVSNSSQVKLFLFSPDLLLL